MSKMQVTFEIENVTEKQLKDYAAQYGAKALTIKVIKPPRNVKGAADRLAQLKTAAEAEFGRLLATAAQGVANPNAVTDQHVADFVAALNQGSAHIATAVKDIAAMLNPA